MYFNFDFDFPIMTNFKFRTCSLVMYRNLTISCTEVKIVFHAQLYIKKPSSIVFAVQDVTEIRDYNQEYYVIKNEQEVKYPNKKNLY